MINRDTLVISNPGTGKTTMISNEVINLIKEGNNRCVNGSNIYNARIYSCGR